MIVYKFGGATTRSARGLASLVSLVHRAHSTEVRNARRVKRPAASHHGIVLVVSAIGHTTRYLDRAAEQSSQGNLAAAEEYLERITMQHAQLLQAMKLEPEVSDEVTAAFRAIYQDTVRLIEGVHITRELSLRTRDQIISAGERFAVALIEPLLRQEGLPVRHIDARELIITNEIFGSAKPLESEIQARCTKLILPRLHRSEVVLVEGFVGATRDGVTTTMGRESSDLSATLIGAALGAKEVVIWKSVAGIFNADPELVPTARLITKLSYAESEEIGRRGARVLYPTAAEPLARLGSAATLRIASPRSAARSGSIGSRSTMITETIGVTVKSTRPLAVALDARLSALRLKPKPVRPSSAEREDSPRRLRLRQEKYALVRDRALYVISDGEETFIVVRRELKSNLLQELHGFFDVIEEPTVAALSLIVRSAEPQSPEGVQAVRAEFQALRADFLRALRHQPVIASFQAGASMVALIEETKSVAALQKVFADLLG